MQGFSFDFTESSILIVEDSLEYKKVILKTLGASPQHVYASDVTEAKSALEEGKFHCILLDLSLPDGSGFEILQLTQAQDIPVIILTSSSEIANKVLGLSLGAQDYIIKPFDPIELKARVWSKINLFKKNSGQAHVQEIGNLQVNLLKRSVQIDSFKFIDLTRKEFDCLSFFIKNVDIVLDRDTLLDRIWGNDNFVLERSVDSTLSSLRKKLRGWDHKIRAVYGVGYKLCKMSKKAAVFDPEILEIFEVESKKQLSELQELILINEVAAAKRLVHKIKGSFSIFSTDLNDLADQIQSHGQPNVKPLIESFLFKAERDRKNILKQTAQAS